MTTASLELSKELYELSGWGDTDKWLIVNEFGETSLIGSKAIHNKSYPAYDLGFMLRKLPRYEITNNGLVITVAFYNDETDSFAFAEADTPENATAKLCIKLITEEVLKP